MLQRALLVLTCASLFGLQAYAQDASNSVRGAIVKAPATISESRLTEHNSHFAPTKVNSNTPPGVAPEGMVWIPGGQFSMGCEDPRGKVGGGPDAMTDARPIHRVRVDGFWMDKADVTNEQFEKFVRDTGYVTVAEETPTAEEFPDAPSERLVPGSLIFTPPTNPVAHCNYTQWWRYQEGANWRHPFGPNSSIEDRMTYPVVHIAYRDALAYAKWAGERLPTEAEWEFAARGGLSSKMYVWGNDLRPNGKWMANTFQGSFPVNDTAKDGFSGIAPVKSFPPNGYGLYDMAGNVWQWCSDWYSSIYYSELVRQGGVIHNPQGPMKSFDPDAPMEDKRVQRGGSFLCSEQYCARYIVGARGKGEVNTSSNHVGFRCVRDGTSDSVKSSGN